MVNIYKEANLQCNYKPTRFLQLINKGALLAAKELINKEGATEGFTIMEVEIRFIIRSISIKRKVKSCLLMKKEKYV